MMTTLYINGDYITSRKQFEEMLHSITDATSSESGQLLSAVCDGVVYSWAKKNGNWNDSDLEQLKAEKYSHNGVTINEDWDRLNRLRAVFGLDPLAGEINSQLDVEVMVSPEDIENLLKTFKEPSTVRIWLKVRTKPKRHIDGTPVFYLFDQKCSIDMSKSIVQELSFSPTKRQLIEAGGRISVKYAEKTFRDIEYSVPKTSLYIEQVGVISSQTLEKFMQSADDQDRVRVWLKVKTKLQFRGECVFSLLGQEVKVDMCKSEDQVLVFTPTKKALLNAGGRIEVTTSDGDVFGKIQYSVAPEPNGKKLWGIQDGFAPKPLRMHVGNIFFTMMPVEGGTFIMGTTPEQGDNVSQNEASVHVVKLDNYYIGETVVTQALWREIMVESPSAFKGDDRPVERVSWDDVTQKFIPTLNRRTNRQFRLPTEAEWEYAARGGNKRKGYKYSGSDDIDDVAWYLGNSNRETHPVKDKTPNEIGLYDMSGNVWEWCQDWYGKYRGSQQVNPTGPVGGQFRVCRGGSWNSDARGCRVSYRQFNTPDRSYDCLGFRLALSPSSPQEEEKKA